MMLACPSARDAIADETNEIFVSAASAWEISTKQRIGKLADVPQAIECFAELVAADGFTHLPINHLHARHAGSYTQPHRDPFDRMLAAQSALERLLLITLDAAFAEFDCDVFW